MEGKQRLLQLLAFTNGPAIDVVQQYFEFKIIRQGTDFEDYLNDPQNKHKLFHERYPKIPCCECIRTTSIAAPSKRGCLGYQQFSKLYNENGNVTAGHEQINRNTISQHCICKVSAQKSIKVIDIDLTLLNAIIQHCCNLHVTTKIAQWMKVIKEVRDTISHLSEGKLEKIMFEQTWKKLEKATLQCAGDIGHTSVKIFQMTIDLITTCSVDKLEKQILQTTDKLSEVHNDLNGIIPTVKSVLSKHIELCDQLCTQSKDLTEVKNLVSGVNAVVEQTKDVMEKVDVKTEESTNDFAMLKEDIGDVKYMLKQIGLKIGMTFQRQEEIHEDTATGKRKTSVTLDVEATSTDWDEKKTTLSLKDEMQALKERVDNDHHDDTEEFIIEKVENKCIHLELSASRDVFGSPQKLRIAIKSLIDQFVKAAELDGNVPATVNMNITVKSALTTEEKKVAFTVFSDNDTLDGSDFNEELKIEQKPRIRVKPQTFKPDQQMASTSTSEILYSRNKVKSHLCMAVKREIQEVAIELISVNLENIKFNLEIKGLPHSLLNSMDKEPGMTIEESIDFSVMWTWHYTQEEHSWNVVSIVDTINSRKQYLCDWFRTEYAKIDISGRLALQTTTSSHTFCSLSSLETAVKSFLGKFIEVCDFTKYLKEEQMIKLDVTSQINEYNVVDDNAKIMTDECENSVDTILTCDDCKKDLICLVCKTNKSLISKLNDILQKQRNTIMRLQRRMSTFGEWNEGFDGDVCLSDDETEDLDFDDSVLKKRKNITETSPEPQEKAKVLKMSTDTETEKNSTDTESVKELQEYVINKEKALQKLGEISVIDWEIKKQQKKRPKLSNGIFSNFDILLPDCRIFDFRRERKKRSAIVGTLAKIVTTNKNKLVTQEDKIYLENLDFLNLTLVSLQNRCQQCDTQGCDIIGICTECKPTFCDDCIRKHKKKFTDHKFVFRLDIARGLVYHGSIFIQDEGSSISYFLDSVIIDIKSVKGMVVIIMKLKLRFCLRVYTAPRTTPMNPRYEMFNQLTMVLDAHKSQIAVIDDNTVAITVPCTSRIDIVNFMTNMITTIKCTTNMTGAIAFIHGNLYIACDGHILTMNLQGESLGSVSLPNIQFLHPVGQNKMYCLSRYNISYLDMNSMQEHKLSELPFHSVSLTSDDCGNIYFILNGVVWKAAHDGTDYKVVLTKKQDLHNTERIFFDISNNLLIVHSSNNLIKIYRKI
ncbi:Hypothetical predicted protein [Mytilus galloprovincialis]|uniref:B box-type domain-containing protein n=1 Tax=Mytilus galloprovincialis TaxID=29158 RepID=A0A8B6D8K6_MYTGA|nr:Hypothetical predicted protein [Mytilus galloprovincialis]